MITLKIAASFRTIYELCAHSWDLAFKMDQAIFASLDQGSHSVGLVENLRKLTY